MLLDFLFVGLLTATVSAQQQYTANFSVTTYNCGATIGCPPKSYPYYDSLYYKNIADQFETESGSGNCWEICAHSPEFYGVIDSGSTGYERYDFYISRLANSVSSFSNRSISANYANSKVNFFSFKSFWAGCTAPFTVQYTGQNFTVEYPANCTITIKGYATLTDPTSNTPALATQSFQYTPTIGSNPQGLPRAGMSQFTAFPAFSAVRVVTFSAAVDLKKYAGPPTLFLDDLVYTVYNRTV